MASLPSLRPTPRVIVVGAGVGGLAAAAWLAGEGLDVLLLERQPGPGGKMRQVEVGGRALDAGPTVLTMRPVFDALFDRLGPTGDDWLPWRRCDVLARHAWDDGSRLDLHADLEASIAAVAAFAGGGEAAAFRAFCARSAGIYRTLRGPFLHSPRPNPVSLAARVLRQDGAGAFSALRGISPFTTMAGALATHFRDPRLRQLFGRYATYCGTSPYVAPATLMLVAHVEREAVWRLEGGVHTLARALAEAGRRHGARARYGCEVSEVLVRGGRAAGVRLASGEALEAEAVVFNGDVSALGAGLLGGDARRAAARPVPAHARSLSALTWHLQARATGFPLSHHTVFFGPADRYAAEFDAIAAGRLPDEPTVYVCAQDRAGANDDVSPAGAERLMCLVNAPAGEASLTEPELARCQERTWSRLARAGLTLTPSPGCEAPLRTTPADFARLFPGSAGALYGPASRGWLSSFTRAANRSPLPGLFLAGGSAHPGPGVPMAALSGRLAAGQLLADLHSTRRFPLAAMPGGISTR
jgi:1-hydroxycarotenoid 3,4-desaturase